MSERTYSEVMDDFRQHIGANEIIATDPEDIFAIEARINKGLADELEAARKREHGDCAKLREALEHMVRAETYGSMERDDLCGRCLEKMFARCKHDGTCWVDKAITALSAPPRNCDVCTVKELNVRYNKFCYAHRSPENGCGGCPLCGEPCCELAWAQMPYEVGQRYGRLHTRAKPIHYLNGQR